ncbi:zinc finger protein [Xylaria sp. CBS 124048]|nr:zinc finger protein [Xylaria sp. CBS 124048]
MGVVNKRTLTKTRRKTRDLDQIKADLLSAKHLSQYHDTKSKEDLPGLGRWYCVECAKWYDTEVNLQLQAEPYTQKEAEAAIGLGTSNEDPHKTGGKDVEMVI